MKRVYSFAVLLVTLCGCCSRDAGTSFSASAGIKKSSSKKLLKLTIGVNDIYCRDTACSCVHYIAARTYKSTLDLLRKKYNIDLKFVYFPEPFNLEKALRKNKFDGALSKPWPVLKIGKDERRDFKRIVDVLDPDNKCVLSGSFAVLKKSPVKTLSDIKGKRLAIGYPDAYEKYYAALRSLKRAGVPVPSGKNLIQNASCSENLDALMNGKVDVAVVSDYALTADCAVDFAKPDDFRIITSTEQIPLTSLLLDTKKVSPANILRLQAALLEINGARTPKEMLSNGFVMPVYWSPEELKK